MTIAQIEKNNNFRVVAEIGINFVVTGMTYRVSTRKASAIFTDVTESDIERMKSWIAFYA